MEYLTKIVLGVVIATVPEEFIHDFVHQFVIVEELHSSIRTNLKGIITLNRDLYSYTSYQQHGQNRNHYSLASHIRATHSQRRTPFLKGQIVSKGF